MNLPVIHKKVKAGGQTAAVITAAVAVAAVFGIDVDMDTTDALLVIAAAASPVIAGFIKRA